MASEFNPAPIPDASVEVTCTTCFAGQVRGLLPAIGHSSGCGRLSLRPM